MKDKAERVMSGELELWETLGKSFDVSFTGDRIKIQKTDENNIGNFQFRQKHWFSQVFNDEDEYFFERYIKT